jgi:hypothetical protein
MTLSEGGGTQGADDLLGLGRERIRLTQLSTKSG